MNTKLLIISAALGLLPPCVAHAQTYAVREIPPVSGDGATYACDVSDSGIVVAVCELADGSGTQTVFHDRDGVRAVMSATGSVDLPFVWGAAVNDSGTFVGTELGVNFPFGSTSRTFVSGFEYLPSRFVLFVPEGASGATDINSASPPFSVGFTSYGQYIGGSGYPVYHAFRVKTDGFNNPAKDLGTLGGPFSRAEAINAAGHVAGVSLTAGGPLHAFVWSAGTMTDIGTLGGPVSWAYDLNDAGVAVGWSRLADGSARAFQWHGGSMTALGGLGGAYSEARGINSTGRIVGMALDPLGRPRAVRFDGEIAIDLNSLLAPGTGWILQHARAINDHGVIVGWGRLNGRTRGFVLTPCSSDVNGDGFINGTDFDRFAEDFYAGAPGADFNGDGFITGEDFDGFIAGFVAGC